MADSCPLCRQRSVHHYHQDKHRYYFQCGHCALVFVAPSQHLPANREKAEYDKHQNAIDDPGYRQFLSRIFAPASRLLENRPTNGLDFGCGPGPALAAMFSEAGHEMALYDVFYHADNTVFTKQYDFITMTEVIEHLATPRGELERLWQCLVPGGFLAVMTKLVIDREAFKSWHYKNDPTHIAFYSLATLDYLAGWLGAELRIHAADAFTLHKPR